MPGRSIILGYGLPLVGLAALVAGAATIMGDQPQRPVETPTVMPPVSPAAAGVSDSGEFIGATAMVESAGRDIAIAPQVAGVIERVEVVVGQRVSRGDVLLVVDSRAAEADVRRAEADLAAAQARVVELLATVPPARARVDSAQAALDSTRAAADRARGDLARAEADLADRLNQFRIADAAAQADTRAISAEALDTRRYAVRSAEASVEAARAWVAQNQASIAQAEATLAEANATLATLVDASTGGPGPVILSAQAAVDQARAALDAARTELGLRVVTSPVDGQILQVRARPGAFAPAGEAATPILVLGVVDPLHVRAQVDEVDVPRFDAGARAWASPRGQSSARYELSPVHVEPLVIPKRRLTGETSERVDTRVLEVVYSLPTGATVYVGQQLDVYIQVQSPSAGAPASGQEGPR